MPLRYTEDPAAVATVKAASEQYLIFYSSRDVHGKLWCPVSFTFALPLSAIGTTLNMRLCTGLCSSGRYRREEILRSDRTFGPDCMGGTKSRVGAYSSNCRVGASQQSPYFLHFIDVDDPLIFSWKTPANIFRSGPWNVESIPTIIRVEDVRMRCYFTLRIDANHPIFPYISVTGCKACLGRDQGWYSLILNICITRSIQNINMYTNSSRRVSSSLCSPQLAINRNKHRRLHRSLTPSVPY